MFTALGKDKLLQDFREDPVGLYNIAAREMSIEGRTGPAVSSLRRCLGAIYKCKPFRMTEEFDDLIYGWDWEDFLDD
jgi:hypothetical protein